MTEFKPNILDSFGRKHDYLRISLTERCNLRCFYCMPEEGVELKDKAEFMTAEELVDIAKTFVSLGVKKIRLTGGEPLVKKNVEHIIKELGRLPIELTLTTNGILVDRYLGVMKEAGIKSINVSLDSLKADRFNAISRREYFHLIMNNIGLLIKENFKVKINVVVIKGVNDDEILDFIKWTQSEFIDVRFIEFMPFDGNNWNRDKTISFQEIIELAEIEFGSHSIEQLQPKPNETARNFKLKRAKGTFGIVSTITNPFCDSCNRIRLTADGKIKNCLFSQTETNLLSAYRENQDLESVIRESIYSKEKERGGNGEFDKKEIQDFSNRSMITIGG